MPPQTQLLVLVQDHDGNSITDADVRLRVPDGEEQTVAYDPGVLRYVADGLEPGTYHLTISGPEEFTDDEREVELEPGENYVQSTLGPEDMPHYRASGGERVFFEPAEGKALLYVHGKGAQDTASDILESEGLSGRPLEEESKGAGVPTKGPAGVGTEGVAEPADRPSSPSRKDEVALLVDVPESDDENGPNPAMKLQTIADSQTEMASVRGGKGPRVRTALPMFRTTEDEQSVEGLTDEIIVRFESGVTESEIEQLADEYGFEVSHSTSYAKNGYVLRREGGLDYGIIDTLSELNELPQVKYAEPNVAIQLEFQSPTDFLYPEQPHLDVTKAEGGWDLLESTDPDHRYGSPDVTIAVADSGVDPTHRDLTGTLNDGSKKLVRSFDFSNMTDQDPAALDPRRGDEHGTCAASSATARTDNDDGVGGVAGNCRLLGLRVIANGVTWDELANSWLWAAGLPVNSADPDFPQPPEDAADVISNSWGPRSPISLPSAIDDALDTLTRDGRDGRGCVVCFSAGNLGHREFRKHHPFAADKRTIAVGATINENPTDPCSSIHPSPNDQQTELPAIPDTRTYFNPFGVEMDVVAPSHTSYALEGDHDLVDPITAAVPTGWGNLPGNAARRTELVSPVRSGDTELHVGDPTGFSADQYVCIGQPGSEDREFRRVETVDGNRLQITALDHDHPTGKQVVTGPNDYERGFGGTSHACPMVAGAAALVLSAAPNLTWQEVKDVIRESADLVDAGQSHSVGKWQDRDGDGVPDFSLWYGHGRLNVRDAVAHAIPVEETVSVEGRVREQERQLRDIRKRLDAHASRLDAVERRVEAIATASQTTPSEATRPATTPESTTEMGARTEMRGVPTTEMGARTEPTTERETPSVERETTRPSSETGLERDEPVGTSGGEMESVTRQRSRYAEGARRGTEPTRDREIDQSQLLADLENALHDVSDAIVELRNVQSMTERRR